MRIKIYLVIFTLGFIIYPMLINGQPKDLFTFTSVHKIEERNSYSIFYPRIEDDYEGIIVLIHSVQASNPKAYGDFIEHVLKKKFIVIYPAYQDYVVSRNKDDLKFISSSLDSAYEDIRKNYKKVLNLPVAFVGHSMGGVIVYELASGQIEIPKQPNCVISICPAEVKKHKIENLNFKKLDSYDVYLIIEEEKDRNYKKGAGNDLLIGISDAQRKRHILHTNTNGEPSKHMNFWSPNNSFDSKNNTFFTYFPKFIDKTNDVDRNFYWTEINYALECAFSRKNCDKFREQ